MESRADKDSRAKTRAGNKIKLFQSNQSSGVAATSQVQAGHYLPDLSSQV